MQQMIMKQVSDLDSQLKTKENEVKDTVDKYEKQLIKLNKENTSLKDGITGSIPTF